MTRALQRSWVALVLAASIAAPGAAQLIDPPTWRSSQQEDEAEPPAAENPPEGSKPRLEKTASHEPETGTAEHSLEPPHGIAEPAGPPRPAPARVEEARPTEKSNPLLALFLSLLGLGVVLFVAERARSWISTNVPLQRILGALVFVLRLGALGLIIAIILQLVPAGQDWILWTLAIMALVIGWSVRDLFADLVAGAVLAAERRVKKGMWVSGDGFQGTVEGRSLRATWLRDGQGHRLTVPNRSMVDAPMVYDAGADAEHEVEVRLEGYDDAGRVRMALTDAILSSPWVLAGAAPVVLRDPADPVVWRVRTKLLEPRFSVHFEGELLERVEDLLRYEPEPEERETVPSEPPEEV